MVPGPEFDEFYAAAYGALVRQLYVVVGDRDEAEDLVQEASTSARPNVLGIGPCGVS